MSNWPHLEHAPITEALIDIRTELPETVTLDVLSSFQDAIRDRFPGKTERFHGEIRFRGMQAPDADTPALDGYLFKSLDGTRIVQARRDGFTFNRLRPYETWEKLRDEARELWEHFLLVTRPLAITRLALRYINRLELPLPVVDFREWVQTGPEIAPSLPQGLSTFFMRMVVPFEKEGAVAIITEALERPRDALAIPFILDIDVVSETRRSPNGPELWDEFERLRAVKNRVFWESITQKTEAMYS